MLGGDIENVMYEEVFVEDAIVGTAELLSDAHNDLQQILAKFNDKVGELDEQIRQIDWEFDMLDTKITSKKRSFKKRMSSALEMSEDLSNKIRKIADGAEKEDDEGMLEVEEDPAQDEEEIHQVVGDDSEDQEE